MGHCYVWLWNTISFVFSGKFCPDELMISCWFVDWVAAVAVEFFFKYLCHSWLIFIFALLSVTILCECGGFFVYCRCGVQCSYLLFMSYLRSSMQRHEPEPVYISGKVELYLLSFSTLAQCSCRRPIKSCTLLFRRCLNLFHLSVELNFSRST